MDEEELAAKPQDATPDETSENRSNKRDAAKRNQKTVGRKVAVPDGDKESATPLTEPEVAKSADDDGTNDDADVQAAPKLIVGLGASAGGLQPLEDFFRTVDPEAGHAYVVVQHLSPDFKSLMDELLSRQTVMAVHRVEDGIRVEANSVYLIPPRQNLTINGDTLHLQDQDTESSSGPQFPIDVFFRSLAKSAESQAIGVILSGTGSDGSRGVRAIDEAGGMVYVQDPATAQFDGMPNAARATVHTLQLLSPAEIATSVSELEFDEAGVKHGFSEQDHQSSEVEKIISLVSAEADNDFTSYKQKTLSRRIARRRVITGSSSLVEYHQLLKDSTEERRALCGDLLISVTNFFRDESAWRYLREEVLPKLIAGLPPEQPLRIWVTACATGEEAYTMAMVANEAMEEAGKDHIEIKVFATDIDSNALERAAAGVYPESIVADVPTDMLAKYFTADGENYVVTRSLREMIIFAPHNALADAPFARMHIVSCRNALIYFKAEAQQRIISMLHFSLVLNGVLFLGASESVASLESEFKSLSRQWCIFSKMRDVRVPIEANFRARLVSSKTSPGSSQRRAPATTRDTVTEAMVRDALQAISMERNWVCVICDGHSNVVHVIGDSNRFLRVPQGGLSAEVTRMVPEGLVIPLRSALHRAQREKQTVNHTGVRCDGYDHLLNVQVIYRPTNRAAPEMFVVVVMASENMATMDVSTSATTDIQSAQQLVDLEHELRQTRENLQATIEELETTNEEQQATNEELTAANEELQSTNEELHSVNEELYTVNSEYQLKINELTEVTNDIDNLLESTDIGVVYLDNELKIRKFTPATTRDVHLLPGDIGRAFDDLTYSFDYPDLTADLRRVLSLGEAIEREVTSGENEYLLVRIHPYRAGSELTIGIVMTFVNITELKRVEDALAQVETRYRHLFQAEMFGITLGNLGERTIVDANDAFLKMMGHNRTSLPLPHHAVLAESEMPELEKALRELEITGTNSPAPVLLKKLDGSPMSVVVGRTLISETDGTYVGFVLATDQLTEQAGLRLQEKAFELETARSNLQQFAYISSHQLKEPIRAVSGFSQLLSEGYNDKLDEKGQQYMGYIRDGVNRMSGVVSDLLLFSRVHTHAEPLEWFKSVNAVRGALRSLGEKVTQSGAKIEYDSLPKIYADQVQMEQVFIALLSNSIDFCGDKPPEIFITATELEDYWHFSVSDNGIGIDPGSHDQVFMMFQQLDPKISDSARGIGLAICKRIMERHQGRIWIESGTEGGAVVNFTLPVRRMTA